MGSASSSSRGRGPLLPNTFAPPNTVNSSRNAWGSGMAGRVIMVIALVMFTFIPVYYIVRSNSQDNVFAPPGSNPNLQLTLPWKKVYGSTANIPTGPGADSPEAREKREAITKEFLHCWDSYKKYAWGKDELNPLSIDKNPGKEWLGLGITILDSLSTMYIMGLEEQFADGREWVKNSLKWHNSFTASHHISLFETNIRALGGLLSAYALSGDDLFLTKARELGERLLRAWDYGKAMPCSGVYISDTQRGQHCSDHNLAEVGTLQLEFIYLAIATRDARFARPAANIIDIMDKQTKINGLYPMMLSSDGELYHGSKVALGGRADSYFEYLLKMWLMTAEQIPKYARMYGEAEKAIIEHMIVQHGSELLYAAELSSDEYVEHKIPQMEHLTCFAGGMMTLAAARNIRNNTAAQREEMRIGEGITATCYEGYRATTTGLCPEVMSLTMRDGKHIVAVHNSENILRPETVESLFILWRTTHNPKYREWGWKIFEAFRDNTRVETGYAGLRDVNNAGNKQNPQQSFFMAETLKYLFLLFSDDSVIPLDQWVFNTEAHPLPIMDPARKSDWMPYVGSDLLF
eukprot:TRINITY_DN3627_c0_g1_i2.p1 TRINITY_DN3627_c0_g1~~TRINITY_DN3627_c0_g1_i2.p1  ORF type:complete len:576 (-),score=76.37 TRINITY_DN3627_c0_g1_i2:85-1812(-)